MSGQDSLADIFLFEVNQLMELFETILLEVEEKNSVSSANMNEIFRVTHTVKGSSAMMNYHNMASLSHALEDVCFFIRENNPEFDVESFCEISFEVLDFIRTEAAQIAETSTSTRDEKPLVAKIQAYLTLMKKADTSKRGDSSEDKAESEKYTQAESVHLQGEDGKNAFRILIRFEDGTEMLGLRAYNIIYKLEESGKVVRHIPADILDDSNAAAAIEQNGLEVFYHTNQTLEELQASASIFAYVETVRIIPDDTVLEEKKAVEAEAGSKNKAPVKQNLISVSVSKLDQLMDLVGELVIAESTVIQNPDLKGMRLDSFEKSARQLKKLSDELQDLTMAIRMVPIEGLFAKMHRIVRDMSKKLDKPAQLQLIGQDTEVDKNIIDLLSDPLMHLIRNSMDHGIESVKDRNVLGKPATGTITLEARNSGSDIMIIIKDDGKGLDREKILKKAKEKGLLNKPEAELTDKEAFSYILLPGFSTNEEVTEFSGRGVGMDVVRENISKCRGSIGVESKQDEGTVITMKIPLTLSIIEGMELAVGSSRLIVPVPSVVEIFNVTQDAIVKDSSGNELVMRRKKCYPVLRMHQHFEINTQTTALTDGIILIAESDMGEICVFADAILGQQQVVLKPLPFYLHKFYKNLSGVAGCTIMGDGSISLILDMSKLIDTLI